MIYKLITWMVKILVSVVEASHLSSLFPREGRGLVAQQHPWFSDVLGAAVMKGPWVYISQVRLPHPVVKLPQVTGWYQLPDLQRQVLFLRGVKQQLQTVNEFIDAAVFLILLQGLVQFFSLGLAQHIAGMLLEGLYASSFLDTYSCL